MNAFFSLSFSLVCCFFRFFLSTLFLLFYVSFECVWIVPCSLNAFAIEWILLLCLMVFVFSCWCCIFALSALDSWSSYKIFGCFCLFACLGCVLLKFLLLLVYVICLFKKKRNTWFCSLVCLCFDLLLFLFLLQEWRCSKTLLLFLVFFRRSFRRYIMLKHQSRAFPLAIALKSKTYYQRWWTYLFTAMWKCTDVSIGMISILYVFT